MAVLKFTYKSDPPTSQIIRVEARKAKDLGTIVNSQEYTPPHVNPLAAALYVPTYEVYNVRILLVDTPGGPGIIDSEYVEEPSLEVPAIFPPIDILVGGTNEQDPAPGVGFVLLPGTGGLKISSLVKLGVGPLPGDEWNAIEGEISGDAVVGVELIGDDDDGNPVVFNEGEQFVVEFEPTLDGNAAAAIVELTEDLAAHIADTDNPHETTKAQVGLSNIPNAKSDAINLSDSNTLATSKAVNDLRNSIQNSILFAGSFNIGGIPGNSDQRHTIVHGYTALPFTDYQIQITPYGQGSNWNADNDLIVSYREKTNGSFVVTTRNIGSSIANIKIDFVLIKYT